MLITFVRKNLPFKLNEWSIVKYTSILERAQLQAIIFVQTWPYLLVTYGDQNCDLRLLCQTKRHAWWTPIIHSVKEKTFGVKTLDGYIFVSTKATFLAMKNNAQKLFQQRRLAFQGPCLTLTRMKVSDKVSSILWLNMFDVQIYLWLPCRTWEPAIRVVIFLLQPLPTAV